MIKSETIIQQLQGTLPFYTDYFSEKVLTVSSLSVSGGTATAVTSTAHGLTTGERVAIKEAKTVIGIDSLTFTANTGIGATGGVVTVVTTTNHDFTKGFGQSITIAGATEADYNGTFSVVDVPNVRTVTYAITTNPTSPATGTPVVQYQYKIDAGGYNGLYTVTVTDTTTFTYPVTQTGLSGTATGTIKALNGLRVSGAVSQDRAIGAYTSQGLDDLWGFVILGDTVTSKDRRISSDAQHTYGPGDVFRSRVIIPFSLLVITPSTNDIAGRRVRDLMEDIKVPLFKSLLRARLTTVLSESEVYATTYSGDFFIGYADAYYIHQFQFETVIDIVASDTLDYYDVPFVDFSLIFKDPLEEDGDDTIMQTLNVSLDETPL